MISDLSKKFNIPDGVVLECADKSLKYGDKFSEALKCRGVDWNEEQKKRLQALQVKVTPLFEKRRKEIQEKQQALEKNKRLGLNFFKVLEEVQTSRTNRNSMVILPAAARLRYFSKNK